MHARRDIHRAALGKGPYSLSASYMHLVVTEPQWSCMTRKDREKHLHKLGTSAGEGSHEEINETEPELILIESFEGSGLPEFKRSSWVNANKILELEGIFPFTQDPNKRIVISLI